MIEYHQLLTFGDCIELKFECDTKKLLKEIKDFEWLQYNPRKKINRYGLSITSLDGKRNGIDLDSIWEYNKENNTKYGEENFKTKTDVYYASEETRNFFNRLKNFSIGISSGQLSLVAALLGYKTGFCSAYDLSQLQAITKDEPKLMVGVGYENIDKDRRLHGTLFNRDIPKQYRTGEDDERWRFPSFDKKIKVEINKSWL